MKNDFRKQLGLSRQFLELGDVISALDATDVLMRMAEEHGGIDEKLAALLARGTCLVVGDVDDGPAKAILQECVTLSQQNGYWSDYTEAKRMLGMLELKHGRSTAALEHWSSVVKTLLHNAETMPLTEKAEVLDSLCGLIEEVLSGFKPNEDTYPLWFNAAKGLLIAYQALSRSEACIRLAEHILSFQLADEDRRTIDELLGMTLMILGKPQKALSYFEEGLIIAEKTASTSGTLSILQNIAKAHKQTGSYLRALGSLERAEVIMRQPQFDREGYKWLHVNNLIEIASIHRDMANTTAARPYLQAALKAIDSLSPYETTTQIEKAAALTNLGLLDSDEGKHDDAIKVQREALKIHKSGGFTHAVGLAQVETNLALALTDADDVEEAIAHWRESLRLNRQIGDTSRVSRALFYLADLERRRQNNAGCFGNPG
jgi:tetratricopeptide (TPR) repeat protein